MIDNNTTLSSAAVKHQIILRQLVWSAACPMEWCNKYRLSRFPGEDTDLGNNRWCLVKGALERLHYRLVGSGFQLTLMVPGGIPPTTLLQLVLKNFIVVYFLKSCNLCITFENSSFIFPKIISVDRSKSYTLLYLKSLIITEF